VTTATESESAQIQTRIERVSDYLVDLQQRICDGLEGFEPDTRFRSDTWTRETGGGGGGDTRVLRDGETFESAGVNFSRIQGESLPPAATARRPELAGARFEAMGVSLVIHPRNPYVPTSHANVRYFNAMHDDGRNTWWFGGGFDLTPYYGFEEDAVHWHQTAQAACETAGLDCYAAHKKWCDEYFYNRHRKEARGVGGLFFDDFNEPDFETCFTYMKSVGDHFLPAYAPVVEKRRGTAFGEREREFQLYRRGRYVEFNLVYDRGTVFGLQTGGRVESILMSMPPRVRFEYDWSPEPGSDEARLYDDFLPPRDWLAGVAS